MSNVYLAIDIGASSGRAIIGSVQNGKITLKETYRFENGLIERNGHTCWNIQNLKENVIKGIKETVKQGYQPKYIGIDTWAVDFVLLDSKDNILGDAVSYRDQRTDGIKDQLEKENILSFKETYEHTGIQYQKFNTIYQLVSLKQEHPEYFKEAQSFLMIPDYLNFILTGKKVNEYTNATTTALLNCHTNKWDTELLQTLDLPEKIFQNICMPGTILGKVQEEITKETGLGSDAQVLLPATHDTGSAFLSVPAKDDQAIFLSSGTWSLMGVENKTAITNEASRKANFTNEGGYAYRYRYLKNIMGLWMIQNVRKEAAVNGVRPSFQQLIKEAEKYSDLKTEVNVDDPRFLAPASMTKAVEEACAEEGTPIPHTVGAVLQVIYNSLSKDYANTASLLSKLTNKTYTSINIVGGGSQDQMLNQRTADAVHLPVYAGPTEGTALGNLIVQFLQDGLFRDLQEARNAVKNSFEIKEYLPH